MALSDLQKANLTKAVDGWVNNPQGSPISEAMANFNALLLIEAEKRPAAERQAYIDGKHKTLTAELTQQMAAGADKGGDLKQITQQQNQDTNERETWIETISKSIGFVSGFLGGLAGQIMGFLASLPVFKEIIGQWVDNSKSAEEKATTALDSQAAGAASIAPLPLTDVVFQLNNKDKFLLASEARKVLALNTELPIAQNEAPQNPAPVDAMAAAKEKPVAVPKTLEINAELFDYLDARDGNKNNTIDLKALDKDGKGTLSQIDELGFTKDKSGDPVRLWEEFRKIAKAAGMTFNETNGEHTLPTNLPILVRGEPTRS